MASKLTPDRSNEIVSTVLVIFGMVIAVFAWFQWGNEIGEHREAKHVTDHKTPPEGTHR